MSNNSQYGAMPMGQGGVTYKAISMQTAYFLELMKQNEENAILYAKTYGDAKDGIVTQFLKASQSSASASGAGVRMDAINSIISAAVGGAALLGTLGSAYSTRTGALDSQINDAENMKSDLNDGPYAGLALEENEENPGAAIGEGLQKPSEEIQQKLNDWSHRGGDAFKDYNAKKTGLTGKALDDAKENDALNKNAIEHAKSPEYRNDISKKLDDYISDLKQQKSQLDSKFNQFVQGLSSMVVPTFTSAIQVKFTLNKAEHTNASSAEQAGASVLQSVQGKQSSFIDAAQQQQASDEQAADAVASSLAQIAQVRG